MPNDTACRLARGATLAETRQNTDIYSHKEATSSHGFFAGGEGETLAPGDNSLLQKVEVLLVPALSPLHSLDCKPKKARAVPLLWPPQSSPSLDHDEPGVPSMNASRGRGSAHVGGGWPW